MAREKTVDKENAILEAAITVFAERGFWNTPTSLISKTAGVADGTLFTYFATKDDLIHAVYLMIKAEIAEALMTDFNNYHTVHDKMRHIWTSYIKWGVNNPERFKVIQQIKTNYTLDPTIAEQASEAFAAVKQVENESISDGLFNDYPVDYLGALMDNQTNMTIQLISANPQQMAYYLDIGFEILWKGVTR